MAAGAASHKLVDPSMSVNKNVTVPDGPSTSHRIPHAHNHPLRSPVTVMKRQRGLEPRNEN
jgi:hypothetical protein